MAINSKEAMLYLRKVIMSFIITSYRSVRAHPYISGMLLSVLILYGAFPSLFGFLISSSPVIVCTGILLGTLLSYGRPNIPEIEEDTKIQETFSLETRSIVDDNVAKKDDSLAVETCLENDMVVNERPVEDVAAEASKRIHHGLDEGVPYANLLDNGNFENESVSPTSWLLPEDKEELQAETRLAKEREIVDLGSVEKKDYSVNQAAADVHCLVMNDQNEHAGLTVQIATSAADGPFLSSLGSPWQPVDAGDVSFGSVSDSDDAESSSPDASMADIIPMLDELHPLLNSDGQPTQRVSDNSDAASSISSQDHESEDGAGAEVRSQKNADAESQEKERSNFASVPWTEDDQKNVMDLGYSEAERNRRLESLIARRRLRKLQRFETSKNLIDLDSFYPTSIPSISAPRRNPFDLPSDYDSNLNLPPIPGSAPSVMQPRHNPFDLPYDNVEELSTTSREYLIHYDFVTAAQRGMLSQRHESSTTRPSLLGDNHQKKEGPDLKPYSANTAFERQISELRISSLSGLGMSSVAEDDNLSEPDVRIKFSPIIYEGYDEQEWQSFETCNSISNKQDRSEMDADTDHSIGQYSSKNIGDTNQTDAFSGMEETGEATVKLPVSDFGKPEDTEVNDDDTPFSSLGVDVKFSEVKIPEESTDVEQARDRSMQTEQVDGAASVLPVYDSSSSENGNIASNVSVSSESFHFKGADAENIISNSLPSNVPEVLSVASPPSKSVTDLPFEGQDLVVSEQDITSGMGEHLVDKNESREKEIIEVNKQDADLLGNVETIEVATPASAAEQVAHPSTLPSVILQSSDDHLVDDGCIQLGVNHINSDVPALNESVNFPEAITEASHGITSDFPSISGESLEDFNLPEERRIVTDPSVSAGLTASDIVEESNICMPVEQKLSIKEEVPKEIGNEDLAMELVPKEKLSDHTVGLPDIPPEDVGSHGSVLTPTDSTGSYNGSGDLQSKITDDISSKQDEGFFKNTDSSGSSDQVHSDVSRMKDIDEGLLSELDAVSDFHIEKELKAAADYGQEPNQLDAIHEVSYTETQQTPNQLQDSGVSPLKYVDDLFGVSSDLRLGSSDEHNPVTEQPLVNSEVGSSFPPSCEDPEMTVYNPKLHVLDAGSIDDLNSSSKQPYEEALAHSFPEFTVENSIKSDVERELDSANLEVTGTDADMLVLEARFVEDITTALKQVSERPNEHSISEVGMSVVQPERTHSDSEPVSSDFHASEAKSAEDISSTSRQGSQHMNEPSISDTESSEVHSERAHLEPGQFSPYLHNVEAKSIEDITSALKLVTEQQNEQSISQVDMSETQPERTDVDSEQVISDLRVAEVKSAEDISPTSRQGISEMESSKVQPERANLEPGLVSQDLPVDEAKTIKDISLALKQASEHSKERSISGVDMSEVQPDRTDLEPRKTSSDLHVVEASSLEDINLALKEHSKVTVEALPEHMKHEDGHPKAEGAQEKIEPHVVDIQSSEAMKRQHQPQHTEAQSSEVTE